MIAGAASNSTAVGLDRSGSPSSAASMSSVVGIGGIGAGAGAASTGLGSTGAGMGGVGRARGWSRNGAASMTEGGVQSMRSRGGCTDGGRRRRAGVADVTLDHRQPVHQMAEGGVDDVEQVLGAAFGFRLSGADFGEFVAQGSDCFRRHGCGAGLVERGGKVDTRRWSGALTPQGFPRPW